MKNIKQLKKEIEELKKKKDIVGTNVAIWTLYHELKAKLQTLQNVCEEIKKIEGADFFVDIDSAEDYPNNVQGVDYNMEKDGEWLNRKELLKKFQGEEE